MKIKILSFLAAAFLLSGCHKEIKLAVKQMHEMDKTELWAFTIDRPLFSTTEPSVEESCVVMNDSITNFIERQKNEIKAQAKEFKTVMDSSGQQMVGPFELIVRDSVYMADENYISVRLLTYSFTGGAHGMTNFYGLNYNVKTKKFLSDSEIIDTGKASQINDLLKAHLHNPDSCFTGAPTIENFTALNFTLRTVDFTYGPYILGPYSCGYTTIAVPGHKMKDLMLIKTNVAAKN